MGRKSQVEIDLMTLKASAVKMSRMMRAWAKALIEIAEQGEHMAGAIERIQEHLEENKQ